MRARLPLRVTRFACLPPLPASPSPPSAQPVAPSPTRARVVFAAKLVLAAALIGWLIRSGNLEFGTLRVLIDRPILLVLDLGLFLLGVCSTSLRFRVLLGLADVAPPISTILRLQMTAYFFNTVIPGSIGGDVVKALYVARDAPASKRTTILLLVFIERLLGVCALLIMAAIIVLIRLPVLLADPLLRPLAITVLILGASVLVGGTLAILIVQKLGDRLDRFTSGPSKIAKLLNQLVASFLLVSKKPKRLLAALGISMTFHVLAMGYFTMLTQIILERDVPYASVATVFALGLLSLMLPISPSGLGVGHVAFKRLFEAIGLAGGASIFNVYLLGQITPSLLGVFPFLSLRRRGELPTADDPAPADETRPSPKSDAR